jgi:hypothetical protein
MDQLIKNGTQTPPVHSFTVSYLFDNLRGQILGSATDRKLLIAAFDVALGKAKVSELDVPVCANEHVFGFEAELERVTRGRRCFWSGGTQVQGEAELRKSEHYLKKGVRSLVETFLFGEETEELTAGTILKGEVQFGIGLEG